MMEYIFSYGTIQVEEVQLKLFGRILTGQSDRLTGYTTSTIQFDHDSHTEATDSSIYLIARPSNHKNDVIQGKVYELSANELLIADEYESDDYKRIGVTLHSGKEAWVYVAVG